ncbi:MAG: transposase [Christensenellaceae bacterium]|jgi:hypothetical protein|nr:transposase [Christensenellaceae bacterium]
MKNESENQTGLIDWYLIGLDKIVEKLPLARISKLIDWENFRRPIEEAFERLKLKAVGRPPFDCILMFKIIFLGKFLGFNYSRLEIEIPINYSYIKFLGLSFGTTVIPDESTIRAFNDNLHRVGIYSKLFETIDQMLLCEGRKIQYVNPQKAQSKITTIRSKSKKS